MATAVPVNLNAFLPWGPVVVAGFGAVAGCLYTQWSVNRRRVRGARFDTGPNGLATYFEWFRTTLFTFLQWAVIFLAAEMIAFQASRWVNLRHAFADKISLVTFGALVLIGLYAGFCAGRAAINGRMWLALELRGMGYAVRDGHRYRVRFIHRSGAMTVDDTPWEARIQAEQEGLSINDGSRHDYLKATLAQCLRVGIWYAALAYAGDWARHCTFEGFFGDLFRQLGALALYYRVDLIIPALVAAMRLREPLASLLIVVMDRLAYVAGAQFACLVQVRENADARIDLSDVMGQTATGNAGFATRPDTRPGRTGRRKSVGT